LAEEASVCLTTGDAGAVPEGLLQAAYTLVPSPTAAPDATQGGPNLSTLGADGSLFGSWSPFPQPGGPLLTDPLSIGLYGPDGERSTLIEESNPGLPARQAISFSVAGDLAAWVETTSTSLYETDWWIVAYEDGREWIAAESAELGVGSVLPLVQGDINVSLAGRTAFWNSPVPGHAQDQWATALLSRDVDGGGPIETTADNVWLHTSDGAGSVLFVQMSADLTERILSLRPGSEPQVVVERPGGASADFAVTALGADADTVAWSVWQGADPDSYLQSDRSWVYVQEVATGRLTEIELNSTGTDAAFVSAGWAAWGNGSGTGDAGEYLLDIRDSVLYRIAEHEGYSNPVVNYPAVAWAVPNTSPESTLVSLKVAFLTREAGATSG
jgi:hypothetical protein